MKLLALDIGGANLKAADGLGYASARSFPLWRSPDGLPGALGELLVAAPASDTLVVTMTGELADCFATKAEGVDAIIAAVVHAGGTRDLLVYLTDGALVPPAEALDRPLDAAASNWHALARFAGRFASEGPALLMDIGSTTTDLIPLSDGLPVAVGRTDPERLVHGELVYTGVVRSPVCAVTPALPWRGSRCPTAQELFATTLDAYLISGDLPEDPLDMATADGRPATRAAALDRLARAICADRSMFSEEDAQAAAATIAQAQAAKIAIAAKQATSVLGGMPRRAIISGQGEFLARRVLAQMRLEVEVISLAQQLGADASRAATAHALATLARETISEPQR